MKSSGHDMLLGGETNASSSSTDNTSLLSAWILDLVRTGRDWSASLNSDGDGLAPGVREENIQIVQPQLSANETEDSPLCDTPDNRNLEANVGSSIIKPLSTSHPLRASLQNDNLEIVSGDNADHRHISCALTTSSPGPSLVIAHASAEDQAAQTEDDKMDSFSWMSSLLSNREQTGAALLGSAAGYEVSSIDEWESRHKHAQLHSSFPSPELVPLNVVTPRTVEGGTSQITHAWFSHSDGTFVRNKFKEQPQQENCSWSESGGDGIETSKGEGAVCDGRDDDPQAGGADQILQAEGWEKLNQVSKSMEVAKPRDTILAAQIVQQGMDALSSVYAGGVDLIFNYLGQFKCSCDRFDGDFDESLVSMWTVDDDEPREPLIDDDWFDEEGAPNQYATRSAPRTPRPTPCNSPRIVGNGGALGAQRKLEFSDGESVLFDVMPDHVAKSLLSAEPTCSDAAAHSQTNNKRADRNESSSAPPPESAVNAPPVVADGRIEDKKGPPTKEVASLRRAGIRVPGLRWGVAAVAGAAKTTLRVLWDSSKKDKPNKSDARKEAFELHEAAQFGYLESVDRLLSDHADASMQDKRGATPLHCAVASNQMAVFEKLLGFEVNLDTQDNDGATPLYLAVKGGRAQMVTQLLQKKADPSISLRSGTTTVHAAAEYGEVDIVRALVQSGASVDAPDRRGARPVHVASQCGHVAIVKALLDMQAEANRVDKMGLTPLHLAADAGHLEVAKLLITAGADVNTAARDGSTALHHAARKCRPEVVRLLLVNGANSALQDKAKHSALHAAVQFGDAESVDLILAACKSGVLQQLIQSKELKDGATPLHTAAASGQIEIVKSLLKYNASVSALDKRDTTALHMAAQQGHTEVVQLLLSKGADVHATDKMGDTALHMAAASGHSSCVQALMTAGALPNQPNSTQATPLAQCIRHAPPNVSISQGHVDTVQILIAAGATVNVRLRDTNGMTVLHLAAQKGNLQIVVLLLAAGGSVSALNGSEETARDLAERYGHNQVVEVLNDAHRSTVLRNRVTSFTV